MIVLTMILAFTTIFIQQKGTRAINIWKALPLVFPISWLPTFDTCPDSLRLAGMNLACDGASIIEAWTSLPIHKDSRTVAPSNLLKETAGSDLTSWCFSGSVGQVGIALRTPGVLSHVGIRVVNHGQGYHWLKGFLLGKITTAPREVVVWGLVDGSITKKQINRLYGLPPPTAISNSGINTHYKFVPIGRFEFDGRVRTPIEQSMIIDPIISGARVEFGVIVAQEH
jgi:hypothetical protein